MECSFYKIIKDHEGKLLFRLNVKFYNPLSINLIVLKQAVAWNSSVGATQIQEHAEIMQMEPTEYYTKLKDHFADTATGVEFKFVDNELIINLMLKNNMKIMYFSTHMEMVSFNNCVLNLLDKIYMDSKDITHRLEKMTEQKYELQKCKIEYEQKLNELVQKKRTEERDLYNNFAVLLNEKKRQILHLNELLMAFKRGRPVLNSPTLKATLNTKCKNKKDVKKKIEIKKPPESETESDTDESYNTDEECDSNLKTLNVFCDNSDFESIPGTSKENLDLLVESSPPRYTLPKRLKSDTNIKEYNVITNEGPSLNESGAMEIGDNVSVKNVSANPTATFNTQDLLDTL